MSRVVDRVTEMVRPIVEARELNLVDVEYQKEGEKWYLRVYIENPRANLELKDCEEVNKMLGLQLDKEDLIDRSYILEVSSPGLERPLKTPQDFQDYLGELIFVKTYSKIEGQKEFEGTLESFLPEEKIVKLELEKGVIEIPLSKIAKANLSIDF